MNMQRTSVVGSPNVPRLGQECSRILSAAVINAQFRQMLLADGVYLNGRLARFYGVDRPADAPFGPIPK